jgi:hypothetical protein
MTLQESLAPQTGDDLELNPFFDDGETSNPAHEAVEQFFADNAEIFATTNSEWRAALKNAVDAMQDYDPIGDFFPGTTLSRESRRVAGSKNKMLKNVAFGDARLAAENCAATIYKSLVTPEVISGDKHIDYDEIVSFAHGVTKGAVQKNIDDLEFSPELNNTPKKENLLGTLGKVTDPIETMCPGFIVAEFYNKYAIARLEQLISDPTRAAYFVERINEMTSNDGNLQEFDGLLEILATDLRARNGESVIGKALASVQSDEQKLRSDYISGIILESDSSDSDTRRTKDVVVAYGVLRSVAVFLDHDSPMSIDEFIASYSQRVDMWPKELQDGLDRYITANRAAISSSIKNGLAPFTRPSRLMPDVSGIAMIPKKHTMVGKNVGNKMSPKGRVSKIDITPEPEIEKITTIRSFAVLKSSGTKGNTLVLTKLDSIDELMDIPAIRNYIAKYPHEQTLEQSVRTTLEHICEHPFDRTGTRTMAIGKYDLDISGKKHQHKPRRLRRFRPGHLAEVHGDIAMQTRIFYDIVNVEGEPTLAIYQVRIKQDVVRATNVLDLSR